MLDNNRICKLHIKRYKIGYIFGPENKSKYIKIIKGMLSDKNGIKLETRAQEKRSLGVQEMAQKLRVFPALAKNLSSAHSTHDR